MTNVRVDDEICESLHHLEIHGLLNKTSIGNLILLHSYIIHTFRDGKEAKEYNTIVMCSSDIIVNVSNREIDWPVLVVSCSYRYSCLITSKDNWTEDRAMSFRVFSNQILVIQ